MAPPGSSGLAARIPHPVPRLDNQDVRKRLVFQHVASEPLGVLDPLLRQSGFRVRYVNFGRTPQAQPEVGRYDGRVVLGGPMNVDQAARFPHLHTETEAIREALRRDLPVLGILPRGR